MCCIGGAAWHDVRPVGEVEEGSWFLKIEEQSPSYIPFCCDTATLERVIFTVESFMPTSGTCARYR